VGLYRHPPARGHIVCFDEMGPLQTIPRGGKAWASKAVRRPDRYRRAGTLQWFGAFCPTTGLSTHPKALGQLPYRLRRRLRVYWLPTNSSWLNLIESHFSVLKRTALDNTDYRTTDEIDEGLLAGLRYLYSETYVTDH